MIQFILLQIQELAERDTIKNAGNQNIIRNIIKNKDLIFSKSMSIKSKTINLASILLRN